MGVGYILGVGLITGGGGHSGGHKRDMGTQWGPQGAAGWLAIWAVRTSATRPMLDPLPSVWTNEFFPAIR